MKEKTWVNTEMPTSLAQQVKDLALKKGIPVSAIVRWALREYLIRGERGLVEDKYNV